MINYIITFFTYFSILTLILTMNLSESYSQTYIKIDGNLIPLLIPPYTTNKGSLNHTIPQIINITYHPQKP